MDSTEATPRADGPDNAGPPNAPLLALCALVVIAAGVAAAIWMLRTQGFDGDLIDLAVYRGAGKAIIHGHSVFGSYAAANLPVHLPFIYPPFSAVLAVPFTLMSTPIANVLWTVLTVALLVGVVRLCFADVVAPHGRTIAVALVLASAAMFALSPLQEHLRFGQVGIPLMACCVFDCMVEKPRWPRGALVGVATAVKLVPGIFIPYLWFTGRRKAAVVATFTFLGCTLVGAVADLSDSWSFFTSRMFKPTSPRFFSNQSLEGLLQRDFGGAWRVLWLAAVVAVVVYGFRRAIWASRAGDELRGVAITGLVGVLVSPISWIHHLVWIVPVIAVIVGTGRDRARILIAGVVALAFVARLPYVGYDDVSAGLVGHLLRDSYGLLCIALLIYICRPARNPRSVDAAPMLA